MDDIGGVWRTIGGKRVFIKDGQDLATAMRESGKFSKSCQNKENKCFYEKISPNDIERKLTEYENEIRGQEIEYSFVIEPDGHVYKYTGNQEGVDIKCTNNSIITHNHTIDDDIYRSFGSDDYKFMKNNNFKELRLTNPDYDYKIIKIKEFQGISYNALWKEIAGKMIFEENFEIQHEIMKLLDKKGYVKYERRARKTEKRMD